MYTDVRLLWACQLGREGQESPAIFYRAFTYFHPNCISLALQ
jgi:hypothetical protein